MNGFEQFLIRRVTEDDHLFTLASHHWKICYMYSVILLWRWLWNENDEVFSKWSHHSLNTHFEWEKMSFDDFLVTTWEREVNSQKKKFSTSNFSEGVHKNKQTSKQMNKQKPYKLHNVMNFTWHWPSKGSGSPRRSSFHFIYPWLEPIWHHVIEKRLDFTHHRQGSCWTLKRRTSVSFWQYLDFSCHTVVRSITIFKIQSTV